MATNLSTFYDYVLPYLPGLTPGTAALNFIRDGVIKLCEKSQIITMDHPLLDITANQPTYAFAPGAGLLVIVPKKVLVNGTSIDPANDDDLDELFGDQWRNGTLVPGPAVAYRIPDESNIQIVPTPNVTIPQALNMRVSVKPQISVTTVDDRLFNQTLYRNAVQAYVFWQAKLTPKTTYSDPNGALMWEERFNLLVGQAATRAAKGFTNRALRSRTVGDIDARNETLPLPPPIVLSP